MPRFQIHALLIFSLSGIACAQQAYASPSADALAPAASESAEIPELDVKTMVVEKPPLRPVLQAMADSNLSKADAEIVIDYNAAGDVTAVRVTKTSSVSSIDNAIVEWAGKLKLKRGVAGTGRLPFTFKGG